MFKSKVLCLFMLMYFLRKLSFGLQAQTGRQERNDRNTVSQLMRRHIQDETGRMFNEHH